jgi:regulatory protein
VAGKISALKVQQKNKERVSVYLDGSYAFGLQAIVAATLHLGQELSAEEVSALRERDSAERAYDLALRYLSYRPRSREELSRHLAEKELAPGLIEQVLARLSENGLLDDRSFAQYWVENREAFRPRGERALRYELKRKGVSEEAIGAALEQVDEAESAYRVAQPLALRLAHVDRVAFRQKLGGLLARRGFGYETVRQTVERLWREISPSDDPNG